MDGTHARIKSTLIIYGSLIPYWTFVLVSSNHGGRYRPGTCALWNHNNTQKRLVPTPIIILASILARCFINASIYECWSTKNEGNNDTPWCTVTGQCLIERSEEMRQPTFRGMWSFRRPHEMHCDTPWSPTFARGFLRVLVAQQVLILVCRFVITMNGDDHFVLTSLLFWCRQAGCWDWSHYKECAHQRCIWIHAKQALLPYW